ncbi:MAG: hypothetical protein RMK00_08060 [Bacteroidota bacterium]|nr:hypothetical protein [Candidatus Kapabacteria bacterium]MCS7303223.1 hypothetical protein [Candidatus Kapabacteria bacterium]MDW8075712.1 hypothetical protein [Bacteroidota bacterium]
MVQLVVVIVLAGVGAAAQVGKRSSLPSVQPTSFTYRLQPLPKAIYTYASEMNVAQGMNIMDMEQTITSTVTMEQEVSVLSLDDATVTLGIRQRNIRVQLRGLEQFGGSDSVLTYPELEGYQLQLTCNRQGKTLSQAYVRQDTGSSVARTVQQQVLEQLSGSGVRMRFLVEFPEGPLSRGQQWTRSYRDTISAGIVEQQIVSTMDIRYTFDGFLDTLGRRCVVVRGESTRYLISGSADQMGMAMSINGDGTLAARYLIERETGMPMVIETTAQIDQRMTLHGQGNTVIPMSVELRGRVVRRQ